jgi:hypothetical protein
MWTFSVGSPPTSENVLLSPSNRGRSGVSGTRWMRACGAIVS